VPEHCGVEAAMNFIFKHCQGSGHFVEKGSRWCLVLIEFSVMGDDDGGKTDEESGTENHVLQTICRGMLSRWQPDDADSGST